MKKTKLKISLLVALMLIVGGLAFIMYSRDQQTVVVTAPATKAQIVQAQAARPVTSTAPAVNTSSAPVSLSIPSLSINLSVVPGIYNRNTGQWTLTSDKAQYAVVTPEPNTVGGNTFIYGHYRRGVFATLHTISMGSEASVATASGKTYTYKLVNIETVSPEDSARVFDYPANGSPILTIQTCTGLLFQDRQLFTFNLERVS